MRAMILAAGRGTRMRELTKDFPKPLLCVGQKYLIEYAIESLLHANIEEIIINVSYQAEQIKNVLGDGKRYGVSIVYSEEKERLETGGGIVNALPLLGKQPFIVVSSDIITDFPFTKLPKEPKKLAHLIMIDNPSFHRIGDFGIRDGFADIKAKPHFTFANIGIYRPELFRDAEANYFPLRKLLFPAIEKEQVTAEHYSGSWFNIGTPEDLELVQV